MDQSRSGVEVHSLRGKTRKGTVAVETFLVRSLHVIIRLSLMRKFSLSILLFLASCAPATGLENASPVRTLTGEEATLAEFGGPVTLVHFWATWCAKCVYEMDALARAYKIEGLSIVAVAVDDTPERISKFLESRSYSFPILLDTSNKLKTEMNVRSLPHSLLIGCRGTSSRVFSNDTDPSWEWGSPESVSLLLSYLEGEPCASR